MKILIIEDEKRLTRILKKGFEEVMNNSTHLSSHTWEALLMTSGKLPKSFNLNLPDLPPPPPPKKKKHKKN